MFQSFMAVPLHFTIEFLGFLVTAGGAFLVLSRPSLVPGPRANRILAAVGLAVLAAAQVVHGGSFVELDGAEASSIIRATGYAFLAVALTGGLRPAAAAAAPLGPSVAAAGASMALAIVGIGSWIRSGARSLLRLAAAALLMSGSELLTSQASGIPIGGGTVDGYSYAAHGARLLGYLMLGSWLWTGVRSSIRARFVAAFVGLLVAVVMALSTALTGVISSSVEEAELARVKDQVENALQAIKDRETQELLVAVRVVANASSFRCEFAKLQGVASGSACEVPPGADLRSLASDLMDPNIFAIDFVVIRARDAKLGWSGEGPARNAPAGPAAKALSEADILKIIGTATFDETLGPATEAVGLDGLDDAVAILAVSDVPDLGTVAIGRYIDALTTEEISGALAPVRASLVVDGKVVASELSGLGDAPIVPRGVERALEAGEGTVVQQHVIGSSSYYSAFATLSRGDGVALGYLVLSSPARIVAQTRNDVTRTLFLVAMGVGAIALGLAWLSGRRIARPIQQLTATAARVREGDLEAQVQVAGTDEVGQLGEAFNEMTAALFGMTSDLKEAAREEGRLRARIETIIQSMADGLVAIGPDRRILTYNRQAEKLTGIKAKSATGKLVEEVLNVRDTQGEKVPLPIYKLAGGSVGGVFLHRRGHRVPVAITGAVLLDVEQDVVGAVAVIRDMTREREVERMKTEFLSNISHELRTPLTPIKGYAEILAKKELPRAKTKQFVGGIIEATNRLERIVELLVDFSAMEAGRLSPRATPVDVGSMVSQLAQSLKRRTPRHDVVVEVSSRLPRVVGDERLLRRSLEEVLDNAVKFSPQGGTIRLEAKAQTAGNGDGRRRVVAVTVADQGIGISDADRDKIFSDFQQLDGSETRSYGGLGLGLAFVRRIVEAHHGSIEVDSAPDQGTRLTISIPAARR